MKTRLLTILALILSNIIFAQKKDEEEIREFFWGANDAYKNVTEVPDKWKNESAVILLKNVNHDYHKFLKNVTYGRSTRERIKLLDKAAVEDYSEFTFNTELKSRQGWSLWNFEEGSIVGLKVIKPDGTEREIDVENEIVVTDGVQKLAISNLEVGDILDYYSYHEKPYTWFSSINFDAVEEVLADEYPIVDYKFYLETENDFFVSFNSVNDAPELKKLETGKKSFRKYELVAHDLPKYDFPRWFYPMQEKPAYKFHVYFASNGKYEKRAKAFLSEREDVILEKVDMDQAFEYFADALEPAGIYPDVKAYLSDQTFANDREKAIAAYYYLRHSHLTKFIEAAYVKEAGIADYPYEYYGLVSFVDSDQDFIRSYAGILKKEDIDFEVVLGTPREDGPMSELLLKENVSFFLKVNTEPPFYASYFDLHGSAGQFPEGLEGTDVYLLGADKKGRLKTVTSGKLPVSNSQDNEELSEMTVKINDDFSGLQLTNLHKFKGNQKKEEQEEKMYFADYVKEDYERYGTDDFLEHVRRDKHRERYERELQALSEKIKKNLTERFEKTAALRLEIPEVENYEFSIVETGRYGSDTYFSYSDNYDAPNVFVKKAGPNYIVEIGKLIGGQVDIAEKEKDRKENIYMNFPRVYRNKIVFQIPEGYSVTGYENLNTKVEIETGGFESSARLEGNTLVIEAKKEYRHNYEPNENWPEMIEFLDSARQFTNEKILLKRT
ncbi:hypothetical protein G3I01_03080 [Gramella sp. MT6]|uniref:DUF3857 domain-containing protein n=1 Tax=Gramella sp. MT6 TaxID=2705471 RepID=UPI001C5FF8BE|nr:DUF3857 domain-containing protein [Gramella sp. MT6]QYA24531.1 hypothetical protein G3I01_03080 [Gramella sp. MT6]